MTCKIFSNISFVTHSRSPGYSAVPNNRVARNKRVGYNIGLFGYYLHKKLIFIEYMKKSQNK